MICASEVKNVLSATCNAFKKGRFWTDGGVETYSAGCIDKSEGKKAQYVKRRRKGNIYI